MTSDDYTKGFKDGFAAGLEEGKKLNDKTYMDGYMEGLKKTLPPPYIPNTSPSFEIREKCPKCGLTLTSLMNYVCHSPNCPTFPQISWGKEISTTMGDLSGKSVTLNGGVSIKDINPMGHFSGKTTNDVGYNYQQEEGLSNGYSYR